MGRGVRVAVVGAPYEDNGASDAGAAYVFSKDQGGVDNWGKVQKITASDGAPGDIFGCAVDLEGNSADAVCGDARDLPATVDALARESEASR